MTDTMFIVRETPWAGLGTVVTNAPNSAEALKLAGMDWNVNQIPLIYKDKDTGYKLNVRDSDEKVLGVVGSRYKPVQNVDAFKFIDELIGDGVRYESAGCVNGGKRVWLLARMPETKILDDKLDPYMCLSNNHDSFGSLKVFMTPVRVACKNMLNLALKSASRQWSVRHTGTMDAKLMEAQRTFGLANNYLKKLDTEAKALYKIKVAPKDFEMLNERLFPITGEMSPRKEESQQTLRDNLETAWEQDDLGNIRGTAWGFMNAVSDMTTHKKPGRSTETSKENAFIYAMDYPEIFDRAYKEIREFAKLS